MKVNWDKMSECQYDWGSLERLFLKCGTVTGVVISEKKDRSALVGFEDIAATRKAFTI